MRITEVNLEAIDLIEAKILDDFSEVKICMAEINAVKICTKANIRVTATKINHGLYHNPHRNFQQGNNYGQFRGRSCGHGRGNYHGHSHGRSNYQGNNNYQYCCILLQENKTWHKVLKHFIKTSNIMK